MNDAFEEGHQSVESQHLNPFASDADERKQALKVVVALAEEAEVVEEVDGEIHWFALVAEVGWHQ